MFLMQLKFWKKCYLKVKMKFEIGNESIQHLEFSAFEEIKGVGSLKKGDEIRIESKLAGSFSWKIK